MAFPFLHHQRVALLLLGEGLCTAVKPCHGPLGVACLVVNIGYVQTGPCHIQFPSVPVVSILLYGLVDLLSCRQGLVVLVQL